MNHFNLISELSNISVFQANKVELLLENLLNNTNSPDSSELRSKFSNLLNFTDAQAETQAC